MIVFRVGKDAKLLGIGLSNDNVEYLKQGKPIKINGQQFGISTDLFIFWGKTEQDIYDDLLRVGLITSDTKVNDITKTTLQIEHCPHCGGILDGGKCWPCIGDGDSRKG